MVAIRKITAVGDSTNVTSRAFVIPADATVGHVAFVTTTSSADISSVPTGWTLEKADTQTFAPVYLKTYRKTAALVSGDLGTSHTWQIGSSGALGGHIFTVDADTTTPLDVAMSGAAQGGAGGTSIAVPGVTTVTAGCLLVCLGGSDGGGAIDWSESSMARNSQVGPFGNIPFRQSAVLSVVQAVAGATGTKTIVNSGAGAMAGQLLAIRPGAVDTTPPAVASRTVNASTLVITYDEPLNTAFVPSASAYTVKVNTVARAVTNVTVGNTGAGGVGVVTLTLASPVSSGQTVTVSYSP